MADRDSYDGGRDYYGGPDYTRDEFERGRRGQRGRGWDDERYERQRSREGAGEGPREGGRESGLEGGRRQWQGEYDRWERESRSGRSPYDERDFGEQHTGREGGAYGRPGGSWQERPTYYGGGGYGVGRTGQGYRGEEIDRSSGRYGAEGGEYGRGGYRGGAQYGEAPYGSSYEGSRYEGSRYEGSRYGGAMYGARGEEVWREGTRGRYFGRGPKGYRRSDERIREEVNERLTMHPEVDASDVEVRVNDGVVTLSGVVEDRQQKRMAEDVVEEIFGVDDVRNELKVRHGFLAALTGEKASDREVSRTTAREESETKSRGARTS